MARRIATGLLIASLILLIVYGADVAVAAASPDGEGFLPFNEAVRGGAFGGGSVVMSIIAFVIARKEYAPIVSALLFVNGGHRCRNDCPYCTGRTCIRRLFKHITHYWPYNSNGGNSNRARRMEGCNRQKTTRYKEKRAGSEMKRRIGSGLDTYD